MDSHKVRGRSLALGKGASVKRWAIIAASGLFLLVVPVFLVTSNVRWAANSVSLWGVLFDRHDVPERTGTAKSELTRGARQIAHYFNSGEEPLRVVMRVSGQEREVFNEQEVQHMADVKSLFTGTFRVHMASGALLGALVVGGLLAYRRRAIRPLARLTMAGGGLTIGLVVLVGLVALISFGPLFTTFHVLSFSNDFWQLDPGSSYLVRMFPQGFWQDMTLLIGLTSVLEALLLMAGALLVLKRVPSAEGAQKEAAPGYASDAAKTSPSDGRC